MTSRVVHPLARFALAMALAGCSASRPALAPTPATSGSAWTLALAQVGQDVQAGRHAAADRVLVDFQHAHPAAPELIDATYYRALYKLDPANPAPSPREATILLDTVLASPIVSSRRADALVLRRVASALEARSSTPVTVVGRDQPPARAEESRGKDEEVTRLREELAKANAELERIKRRVATPKP